eukprot:3124000-Karenia_brevis.AAC.1
MVVSPTIPRQRSKTQFEAISVQLGPRAANRLANQWGTCRAGQPKISASDFHELAILRPLIIRWP